MSDEIKTSAFHPTPKGMGFHASHDKPYVFPPVVQSYNGKSIAERKKK